MLNKDRELAYLRAAIPLLKDYLLSHDVAWQLPGIARDGEQPYSQLTLGPLLLILKRLKARGLTGTELEELGRYEEQIFQEKIHNESAWKKKAGQDMGSRMRLWQTAWEDYQKDQQSLVSAYPLVIAQRVMLQLLWDELEPAGLMATPLQFALQMADTNIKLFFQPGDFIWEPVLKPGFPEDTYWYLYGTMNEKVKFK
jgi:hypothetical protein